MGKFRKKQVVIEAWEWDETRTTLEKIEKIGCKLMSLDGYTERPDEFTNLSIETPEGTKSVNKGDYIIKDEKGDFYPCKPDIFKATYEAVL